MQLESDVPEADVAEITFLQDKLAIECQSDGGRKKIDFNGLYRLAVQKFEAVPNDPLFDLLVFEIEDDKSFVRTYDGVVSPPKCEVYKDGLCLELSRCNGIHRVAFRDLTAAIDRQDRNGVSDVYLYPTPGWIIVELQ